MFLRRQQLLDIIHNHLVSYPTPVNINYFWGFGSIAGLLLGSQIITGLLLAMHYAPTVDLAFGSLEHIMRDVNYGWFLRYLHANGASYFFLFVYAHLGRSFVYGLYTHARRFLWFSGLIIFFLMMAIAFMGYVLPWGQMSFWGATVITNLFTVIPFAGEDIAYWLWGGFSVGNATLTRFFGLHFCLPFILLAVVFLHLALLHQGGSSTVFGLVRYPDKIFFYPYFYVKDYFGVLLVFFFLLYMVSFKPDLLGHSDNYILANPLVTPTHIVPEWYFLPYYALLRSIPNKLAGVVVMGLSICVCLVLPFYSVTLRSGFYQGRLFYRFFVWCFLFLFIFLGFLGGQPIEMPYSIMAQIFAFFYFLFFSLIVFLDYVYSNYLFFWGLAKESDSQQKSSAMLGFFYFSRSFSSSSARPRIARKPRKQPRKYESDRFFSATVENLFNRVSDTKVARFCQMLVNKDRRLRQNRFFKFRKPFYPTLISVIRQARLRYSFSRRSLLGTKRKFNKVQAVHLKSKEFATTWFWTQQALTAFFNVVFTKRLSGLVASYFANKPVVATSKVTASEYRHPYHLVTVSLWPFSIAYSLGLLLLGILAFFHRYISGEMLLTLGLAFLLYIMYRWFKDIVREGTYEGNHLELVQVGLKYGMLLFILSEVLFFFAFFWSFFHASLVPAIQIGGIWPPLGVTVFNPWEIPLLNTVILLTSGATITWAHFAVRLSRINAFRQRGYFGTVDRQWVLRWSKQNPFLFVVAKMCKFKYLRFFLASTRSSRRFVWEDIRPMLPSRRLSLVFSLQGLLSYFRSWNVHTMFRNISKRKKNFRKYRIIALRRHVLEYNAALMSLLSYFVSVPYLLPANTSFLFNNVRYFTVQYKQLRQRFNMVRRFKGQLYRSILPQTFLVKASSQKSRSFVSLKALQVIQPEAAGSRGFYSFPVFSSAFVDIFRFVKLFNIFFLYRLIWTLFSLRWIGAKLRASYNDVAWGFLFTILLGVVFTGIQYFEYLHALYTIADSAYGTTFFLTTGFHGLHVIIGTLLLLVSYIRMIRYHYTLTHHVGMEAAIWYWHFVDVVWLGLYISVYHWGGQF